MEKEVGEVKGGSGGDRGGDFFFFKSVRPRFFFAPLSPPHSLRYSDSSVLVSCSVILYLKGGGIMMVFCWDIRARERMRAHARAHDPPFRPVG